MIVSPPPPSQTERVLARRVLVIAPHYDDEVLGCGGLIAQLTAAGTHVAVMFLSDSAGAPGDPAGGVAYGRRRRAESESAGVLLGIAERLDLGLPDGALSLPQHITAAAEAIAGYLRPSVSSPDLVLLPSPLEISSDHRAACAAVHTAIQQLRGTHDEAMRRLDLLLYEVNHSSYPDLLVDVSEQVERIEAAMACYASQQERHDYLAAALGHRRFRTLTLARGVTHAEGYRRLSGWDFATRSLAHLIAHVGGVVPGLEGAEPARGPLVSVIIRTRDRPRLVREALASVAAGLYRDVEIVLVNDGGTPPEVPEGYPFPVTRLEHERPRGRAAAAQAGIDAARGDYVSFLDDDDLVAPEHLATLVAAARATAARVVYVDAAVAVYELVAEPGVHWTCVERELPYGRDFDADRLLVDNYIPLNTLLIERSLFGAVGAFDESLEIFEDWDMLIRLAALTPFQRIPRVTCEYRQFRGSPAARGQAQALGEDGWRRPDFLDTKARILAKHAARLDASTLARVVVGLRAEVADAAQQARHVAREARAESATLRRTLETVNTELRRVYGEEARLTAAIQQINARSAADAEAAVAAATAAAEAASAAAATAAAEAAAVAVASVPLPLPVPVRALAAPPVRKASVLIASWNGRQHLETCLDALNGLDTPGLPWDCWVLDNGSTDGTVEWLRTHHPCVRIIASPTNFGFCAANNQLAAAADGDLLIFLNNDTRPTREWLGQLIEALAPAPPDVAAAAGVIVDWEGQHLDFARGVLTFDGHAFQVDSGRPLSEVSLPAAGEALLFACGGNMIAKRSAFLAAGGFDEQFFAYYDDVDLGWRLWSGGERVISAPQAVVRHRSASTSDTLGQYRRGFLFERNAFLTAAKNYDRAMWDKMMPAVMLTLMSRLITFLTENNPGGATLGQDPFGEASVRAAEPHPAASAVMSRWFRRGPGQDQRHPVVSDPLTIMQTQAITWLLRHLDAVSASRQRVQARRRRSDAEIIAAFPLHLVPTYAGDAALFQSAGFRAWLPDEPRLVFRRLDEIMARR